MFSERVSWGGLKSYVVHNAPEGRSPKLAVVLCHGYGAPGLDLVGLGEALWHAAPELAAEVALVFPAAPLALDEIGLLGGRAWWMLDLERLLNNPTRETLLEFRCAIPAGLPEARERIVALVEQVQENLKLSRSQIVLGGFSQGAMLAIDVALNLAEPPAALCILSGGLICHPNWQQLSKKLGKLKVLQSHGRRDAILRFSEAQALQAMLVAGGADVEFIPFDGGHEIPPQVVARMADLLKQLLAEQNRL